MDSSIFTFTEEDHQKKAEITIQDTIVIALEAQPGTGYSWTLPNEHAVLQLLKKEFKQADTLPGGKEYQYFYFRPISTGSSELTLHYKRPWEKEILRSFSLKFIIH